MLTGIALPSLTTFGTNLRQRRLELRLTQERLAQAIGMTTSEVSRLERAEREPRLTTIVRLARALEMHPGDLFDDIEADEPDDPADRSQTVR